MRAVNKVTKEVKFFRSVVESGMKLYYINDIDIQYEKDTGLPMDKSIPMDSSAFLNYYTPLIDKITSLDEYQKLAARTLPDLTEFYPDVEGQSDANHLHMWFGLDSEIGEIIDLYKKSFAYRKKFDTVNLLEEVCDIMWYLAGTATLEELALSEYLDDIVYTGKLIPIGDYPTIVNMDDVLDSCREYNEAELSTEDFIGYFIESEKELFRGLTNNINKLIIRYPDKFTSEDATNRSLDVERNELEK
jgi:hypothetical protein